MEQSNEYESARVVVNEQGSRQAHAFSKHSWIDHQHILDIKSRAWSLCGKFCLCIFQGSCESTDKGVRVVMSYPCLSAYEIKTFVFIYEME